MSTTTSLGSIPVPSFVNDADGLDPVAILRDMQASFAQTSQRVLYQAQLEQLLINLYAYREALVRNAVQQTGLQNLLAFAIYPAIDFLGQLVGVSRLAAMSAVTNIQFNLTNALTVAYTLAQGTLVGTYDGSQVFATTAPLTIPVGITSGIIQAAAQATGSAANGYLPGQVNILITSNALIASAINTATTSGGSDAETDDHLRQRIQLAPNQFSSAGPTGAYRFFALSADASIIDVQVTNPVPGTVALYVLTGPVVQPSSSPNPSAIASTVVLNEVQSACSADTARPLNDTVLVYPVIEVDYTVTASVILYSDASQPDVANVINTAASGMMAALAAHVGQDLIVSQWITAFSVTGVYSVDVLFSAFATGGAPLTPTPDGSYVLLSGEWANCLAVNVTYIAGTERMP